MLHLYLSSSLALRMFDIDEAAMGSFTTAATTVDQGFVCAVEVQFN